MIHAYIYCDHTSCDTHQREDSDNLHSWWMVQAVQGCDDEDAETLHFCCADHLTYHFAKFEPMETISMDGEA